MILRFRILLCCGASALLRRVTAAPTSFRLVSTGLLRRERKFKLTGEKGCAEHALEATGGAYSYGLLVRPSKYRPFSDLWGVILRF